MSKFKYTIRPMNETDKQWLYSVKKNAFKRYVVSNWGSWDSKSQHAYFDRFIEKYKGNLYIIRVDGKDIGFYAGKQTGPDSYHLGTIVIIPEYQGHGIATSVLRGIINANRSKNIDVKYFKTNPVAHLYERLGFVPYGETKYHYHVIKWGLHQ